MTEFRDTIAAISTPAGEGAIALIRISGPEAVAVADRTFRGREKPSQFPSHTQRLGEIVADDRVVDQVMLSVHRAPATYTGEDLVEISGHGGTLVSARVLEACLRAGARAADPGEFTERAFHNGKMDLTQAEAVIDLIRAQTDLALRAATEQLEGRLGDRIRAIRDGLVALRAQLEASIDFPEEGIAPESGGALCARADTLREQMKALLATAEQGRILREGVRVVIYGATNAGKSSLLNRLLGYDRAIVSDVPGTTRDTIEETVNLRGIPLRVTDTAGLRPSTNELERTGMARTEKALALADLLLHIADRNAPRPPDFAASAPSPNELLLLNKSDLSEHPDWAGCEALRISCATEAGLVKLEEQILERITQRHLRAQSGVAINTRHRDCLRRALAACDQVSAAIAEGVSPEYVTVDLRTAFDAVGEVLGVIGTEEILDSVFSQFCIGK
jgi:tRNA modification GTPase